jgi:hypothetical protein
MDTSKKKKELPATKAEPTTSRESASTNAGPVKVLRIDDVSVSIFARSRQIAGQAVTFYSASFSRSYKDAAGERKYTKSFDVDDLGKLVSLAQQASEYIQDVRVAHAA